MKRARAYNCPKLAERCGDGVLGILISSLHEIAFFFQKAKTSLSLSKAQATGYAENAT